MTVSLTFERGNLVFRVPFCPHLTQALKANVPASERKWDGDAKAWRIAPAHAELLVELADRYLKEYISVPGAAQGKARAAGAPETRLLDVRYIAQCKDRGGGDRTAFAWSGGSWSVVFPEAVLRAWFADDARPDEQPTLYAVLGLPRTATAGDLKTAYRRLAKQWHPDVCRERDAAAQFKLINHAYHVLDDAHLRAKYDAGLKLEALAKAQPTISGQHWGSSKRTSPNPLTSHLRCDAHRPAAQRSGGVPAPSGPQLGWGYRPPLRCGYLLVSGVERFGHFIVQRIEAWEDIVDSQGRTLTTSWLAGAEMFCEDWI